MSDTLFLLSAGITILVFGIFLFRYLQYGKSAGGAIISGIMIAVFLVVAILNAEEKQYPKLSKPVETPKRYTIEVIKEYHHESTFEITKVTIDTNIYLIFNGGDGIAYDKLN